MKSIDILLVDDNPGDVELARVAIEENKLDNRLFVVENGLEALRFLRKEGIYADKPLPDIIILDLNMPVMDGRAALKEIKSDPQFRIIPVVILTTSQAEEDVLRSYNLHANCFISKPLDFEQFMKVVRSIENFWLSIVKLPHKQ